MLPALLSAAVVVALLLGDDAPPQNFTQEKRSLTKAQEEKFKQRLLRDGRSIKTVESADFSAR